jgi:hypothetical protein
MNRREFLLGTTAATVSTTGVTRAWARQPDDQKRARIALMSFSLNSILKDNQPASPARTLDIEETLDREPDQARFSHLPMRPS